MTRSGTRTAVLAVVLSAIAMTSSSSNAVTTCRTRVNPRNGTIQVSATGVSGPLLWGDRPNAESAAFFNAATCVTGDVAKNCELGAPGSPEAIIPPDLCTIYVSDNGAECAAYVKKCVPGVRPTDAAKADALKQLVAAISFHHSVPTIVFSGVNVQVDSGSGRTDGPVNGSGNLIIGYNEPGTCALAEAACVTDADCPGGIFCLPRAGVRSGSHNIIIGPNHTYASYGGLVGGRENTIEAPYASVTGGFQNFASGNGASVSGGHNNTASGAYASVTGGDNNTASGVGASVSGGSFNSASNSAASVSGGGSNTASGTDASVSGGFSNTATGAYASVSGGAANQATSDHASVSAGDHNLASGADAAVSGGNLNTASGRAASVTGGVGNTASGDDGSVTGGANNTARTTGSVSGGLGNTADGGYSSVCGGQGNRASGLWASVGGGSNLQASNTNEWHAARSVGFPTGTEY